MITINVSWSLGAIPNKSPVSFGPSSEHLDHEISMPEYLALLNGHPVSYDQAGIQSIQKRAFEMLHTPNISAAKLATLLCIFHYKTNLTLTDRRETRADQRLELSRQKFAHKLYLYPFPDRCALRGIARTRLETHERPPQNLENA